MKNRKKVLIAFVVCAALLMSVGYATLTTTLVLDGTAYIKTGAAQDEFEGDVIIEQVTALNDTNSNTTVNTAVIDAGSNSTSATFGINSLGLDGDTAKFTVKVKSTSEFKAVANVMSIVIDNQALTMTKDGNNRVSAKNAEISVACNWAGDDYTLEEASDTTPSYVTLEITFTLLQTPQTSHDHTFKITVDATTVEDVNKQ